MYLTIRSETSFSLNLHSLVQFDYLTQETSPDGTWTDAIRFVKFDHRRVIDLLYVYDLIKAGRISLRFIFFLYFCLIRLLNLKNLLKNSTEIIKIQ